ncbi:MAG: hypothetical protein N2749_05590 [Clostridia bacterium]|nr:hypothetical protein [Clostridia bacterium]
MNTTPNPYIENSLVKTNQPIAMDQSNLNGVSDFINAKIAEFLKLPDGQSIQSVDWSNIRSILSIISTTLITVSLTVLFLWLIRAIGLYVMSKKRGNDLAFLAFIPYGCMYTMGKIIGKTKIFGIEVNKPEFVLPLLILSMSFPFAAPIAAFVFVIAYNSILYRIYQEQCPNFAMILAVIGFFLPFLQPFFIFFIRNNKGDRFIVQRMQSQK